MRVFRIPDGSVEALKWLAMLAMVVDHVNLVFFGRELGVLADAVGRVAMPLFALVIGYNLARPHADLRRCLRRLLVFGFLALPAHALLFAQIGGWWPLNILFTFAVAVAFMFAIQSRRCAAAVPLLVLGSCVVEYFLPGVALVLASWLFARHPSWRSGVLLLGALVLLCVVNGNGWALLAVPVVAFAARADVTVPRVRMFFWWFYPAHLAVLALASVLVV